MLGIGDKNKGKPHLVGAKEKRELAKQLRNKSLDQIKSKREGKEPSLAAPVLSVYLMSVAVAWFMTQDSLTKSVGLSTGNFDFDRFMFGPGVPEVLGDTDTDAIIAAFLRGFVIFLAAGALPGLTWLWQRLLDNARMNVYVVNWGIPVGIGLFYYIVMEFLAPAFESILGV